MGYRTVVEFNNDELRSREEFIANASHLYDMIISNGRIHAKGARVIEQEHNDVVSLLVIEGCGDLRVASCRWNDSLIHVKLLKQFAEKIGYTVEPKRSS